MVMFKPLMIGLIDWLDVLQSLVYKKPTFFQSSTDSSFLAMHVYSPKGLRKVYIFAKTMRYQVTEKV